MTELVASFNLANALRCGSTVATFGENVRRLREAASLKGIELAARVGVTPPVISAWEKNRSGLPETPTLLKLAKALAVSVDDLLAGIDPEYDTVREERAARTPVGDVEVIGDAADYKRLAIPILFEGEASPNGLAWAEDDTPLFHVDDWGSRPGDVRDPRAYLVIIRGDSMEPLINMRRFKGI